MQKFSYFLLMESDKTAFFKAMMGDPATAALVFADWLQENDQPEFAEAIRIVFQGTAGEYGHRDRLVSLMNQEVKRLRSDGYTIAHNGTVVFSGSLEPTLYKFLTKTKKQDDEGDAINLNFDGHNLYGYRSSGERRPVAINPEMIAREETIEAVILSYLYILVSNIVGPSPYGHGEYQTRGYKRSDFDVNKRVEAATVYNSLLRMTGLIESKAKGHLSELKQEISTLEKMPEVQDSRHYLYDILEVVFENYTGDTPLRKRILAVLIKHSGDHQLIDLIHFAGNNDEDRFCPIISAISRKLKYEELASVFDNNPIVNPLFTVNIYETEYTYEKNDEGEEELQEGEPDHRVEDEQCDLGTTLRHMEEFQEPESGATWLSTHSENYRTGAETHESLHLSLTDGGKEVDPDTLDILYKAAHQR